MGGARRATPARIFTEKETAKKSFNLLTHEPMALFGVADTHAPLGQPTAYRCSSNHLSKITESKKARFKLASSESNIQVTVIL